jgi:hypothetical protein
MSTPHEALAAFELQSEAERFVDDVTLLRMLRVRIPQANPADYAADGTAISDRHMRTGQREKWDVDGTGIVDIAHRFDDGSLAVRIKATQRWEVWRTW